MQTMDIIRLALQMAVSTGGSVDVGAHYYKVSYVINSNETILNETASRCYDFWHQTVNLTAIPTYSGPFAGGTVTRKIYRTKLSDNSTYYLLATIANNTTTTYDDTTADASLGATHAGPSYSIMLGTGAKAMSYNQLVVGDSSFKIYESYWGGGIVATSPQNFSFYGTSGSGSNVAGASLIFGAGRGTGTGVGGDIIFQTAMAGSSGSNLNNLSEVMRISTNGNVSVGNIASPLARLQVAASDSTYASFRLTGGTTTPSTLNGGEMWYDTTGSVDHLYFRKGQVGTTVDLLASVGGGANTTLNNLGTTAINTNLVSDADNTDDLGSSTYSWKDIYTRTTKYDNTSGGTITVQAQDVAGTYTLTLPSTTGTLATNPLTTEGDLIYRNGTGIARLGRGNDGECLKSNTTTIIWGSWLVAPPTQLQMA